MKLRELVLAVTELYDGNSEAEVLVHDAGDTDAGIPSGDYTVKSIKALKDTDPSNSHPVTAIIIEMEV